MPRKQVSKRRTLEVTFLSFQWIVGTAADVDVHARKPALHQVCLPRFVILVTGRLIFKLVGIEASPLFAATLVVFVELFFRCFDSGRALLWRFFVPFLVETLVGIIPHCWSESTSVFIQCECMEGVLDV
jgi:hypothetical protein